MARSQTEKPGKLTNKKLLWIYLLVEVLYLLAGVVVMMIFLHTEGGLPMVDAGTIIGGFLGCMIVQLICCGISGVTTLVALVEKPRDEDLSVKKTPSTVTAFIVATLGVTIFSLVLCIAVLAKMSLLLKIWFGVIIATHVMPTCILFFKKR